MAKFLDTQAISHELMNIIKQAKDKIILVSPYLQVNSQIQERLRTKASIGTLSEIVIIYGKSELQNSEIDWMRGILDLKVIEKSNLHAKCYLNEDKAIICSMNLYEYSQQNNIEMGFLITKEHDRDAYDGLIEEINNIKVNGNRKKVDTLEDFSVVKGHEKEEVTADNGGTKVESSTKLTLEQIMYFEALKEWRLEKSRSLKTKAYTILTDKEIRSIVTLPSIDKNSIFGVLSKKKANQYAANIVSEIKYLDGYTIGKVTNIYYQTDESSYDRVKLQILESGKEAWFDTVKELPMKGKHVAVKLNKNWFNDYFYLD